MAFAVALLFFPYTAPVIVFIDRKEERKRTHFFLFCFVICLFVGIIAVILRETAVFARCLVTSSPGNRYRASPPTRDMYLNNVLIMPSVYIYIGRVLQYSVSDGGNNFVDATAEFVTCRCCIKQTV